MTGQPLDRDKLEAAVRLGLAEWCPECGGTGEPTVATGPAGAIALECDCSGFGIWVPDEPRTIFRKVVDLVNTADEHMPIEGDSFPDGWAHLGVKLLIEQLARSENSEGVSDEAVEAAGMVIAESGIVHIGQLHRIREVARAALEAARNARPRNENYAEHSDQEKQ